MYDIDKCRKIAKILAGLWVGKTKPSSVIRQIRKVLKE